MEKRFSPPYADKVILMPREIGPMEKQKTALSRQVAKNKAIRKAIVDAIDRCHDNGLDKSVDLAIAIERQLSRAGFTINMQRGLGRVTE